MVGLGISVDKSRSIPKDLKGNMFGPASKLHVRLTGACFIKEVYYG